ncbi:P1 family peptidase [Gimibacter soli]|uniref:P1 family peptidase n=1 Tax=Gimibacter soli TaxID=3024400 RepID=A0AAE9XQS9_9PROT|nr:P1 family peptidase [Gimibacter soli]WCL53391.1 P1 family peptidase [Gimibacter soli]
MTANTKIARFARRTLTRLMAAGATCAMLAVPATADTAKPLDNQETLPLVLNKSDRTMDFDWPLLHVGTGEYEDGPTGVTVFHFQKRVLVQVDVRGGGPGTVNAPYMDLGYDFPELDTIVFSGGSWYGLESVTAVASALKDDGIRDGDAFSMEPNIAMSVGSIIFDFGSRRLNEIYPDKRLAQAAFRAAKPGAFPLGARGAGRFAKSGGFFGCNAFSGQGGAFKQVGDLKIAAFVVANPYGVITDRDGKIAACYKAKGWPKDLKTAELMQDFPESRKEGWTGGDAETASAKNTTISLIVTNQKLTPPELKRLAVQVHTSMGRGIQPFATQFDGDVLYAVSTAEVEGAPYGSPDLGVMASEVMWDAILASVPEQPKAAILAKGSKLQKAAQDNATGAYEFSRFASLEVTAKDGKLFARAVGKRPVYGIGHEEAVELQAAAGGDYTVPGRYPLTIHFPAESDTIVLNPGNWQQVGKRK